MKKILSSLFIISLTLLSNPVLAEGIIIHLQVETPDASLYDQDLSVSACADSQSGSTTSINAKCAIEQSGLASDWGWYSDDAFLNSIASTTNNDSGNGIYWQWFADLDYGQTSLNKHILKGGEHLLLTYDLNPLRISTSSSSPAITASTTLIAQQFGLDASWIPVWSPAASSTFVIDGQETFSSDGNLDFIASDTQTHVIFSKKEKFLNSPNISITPIPLPTVEPVVVTGNTGSQNSGGGGGGSTPPATQKFDTKKAFDFLTAHQNTDGSFTSALITDWSALAMASYSQIDPATMKIKAYLLTDPDVAGGMNDVSDQARRTMALLSMNIDPYNGTKTDYISRIAKTFDGQQFGDSSLFNDDIFALLVLPKAGYAPDDVILKNDITYILTRQSSDGSWGSVDLTAAATQALSQLNPDAKIADALARSRNFLKNSQLADGGFGNVYSTSWVIPAIKALGDNGDAWLKDNQAPLDYLAKNQAEDGGLEKNNSDLNTRLWATAYTLTAASGKSWISLMSNFAKPELPTGSDMDNNSNEENASTTQIIFPTASTTPDMYISTSTEMIASTSPIALTKPKPLMFIPAHRSSKPAIVASQPKKIIKTKLKKSVNPTKPKKQIKVAGIESTKQAGIIASSTMQNKPAIAQNTTVHTIAKFTLIISGLTALIILALL